MEQRLTFLSDYSATAIMRTFSHSSKLKKWTISIESSATRLIAIEGVTWRTLQQKIEVIALDTAARCTVTIVASKPQFELTSPADGSLLDVAAVKARPHGSGLIHQVAETLGSSVISSLLVNYAFGEFKELVGSGTASRTTSGRPFRTRS